MLIWSHDVFTPEWIHALTVKSTLKYLVEMQLNNKPILSINSAVENNSLPTSWSNWQI